MNYHDPKIRWTLTHDIRKPWTAVSTLLGFISSVYRDFHHWRSSHRPQIAVPKLYNCATSCSGTQVTPNQLVMVIVRPINLNVSCKLHPYSLQKTRSPPRPRLPRKIRNTHPRNYYDLKGKDIDLHFLFLCWGIILWIELLRPGNPANTYARHTEIRDSCFDLIIWLVDLASLVCDMS